MKKKNYIILSVTVMTALLIVSCGSTDKKEDTTTPVVKAYGTGTTVSQETASTVKVRLNSPKVNYIPVILMQVK